MTDQVPEHITNQFNGIDLSNLYLRKVIIGEPSTFNRNEYPFKIKGKKAPGYIMSACWRGYVAYFSLNNDGSLTLVKYKDLAGTDQFVNEVLVGDFWMEMEHRIHDGNLFIPFSNGKIVQDQTRWQGDGEAFSCHSIANSTQFLDQKIVDAVQIRDFVSQRKISYLTHFTRIENLPSILQNGLIGREELNSLEQSYIFNDNYRLDHIANSICLSISFPNYKMFYPYRCEESNTDWVVLRLKPEILWSKNCMFCVQNAAKREVAQQPIEQKLGIKAFQNMFENQNGYPPREVTEVPLHYPTNPQAEVLALERIDPSFIVDVLIDRKENIRNIDLVGKIIKENSTKTTFYRGKDYFFPRQDHKHW